MMFNAESMRKIAKSKTESERKNVEDFVITSILIAAGKGHSKAVCSIHEEFYDYISEKLKERGFTVEKAERRLTLCEELLLIVVKW